jgi:hypothetical protein
MQDYKLIPRSVDAFYHDFRDTIYPEDHYKYEEIYPKVLVYKNVFKDVKKIEEVMKQSSLNPKTSAFLKDWIQWGGVDTSVIFGQYVQLIGKDFSNDDINTHEKEAWAQQELDAIKEVIQSFFAVTNHFMKKFNIKKSPEWKHTPPSFCRYIPTDELINDLFMQFHTDYQIEQAAEPGDKFVITSTMYINDDYQGGEILFKINKDKFIYKPEAGDILVFPSGHPAVLMEGEHPIMHAVNPVPVGDPDRYMIRMFHQVYSEGDDVDEIISQNIIRGQEEEIFKNEN